MPGVLGVLLASSNWTHYITVGSASPSGSVDVYGFNDGQSAGSVSPSTAIGLTINIVQTIDVSGTVTDFQIQLDTEVAQGAFTTVFVEDGAGAVRQYDTASAGSFANDAPAGTSTWTWGIANDDGVYASGDVGKVRGLRFVE